MAYPNTPPAPPRSVNADELAAVAPVVGTTTTGTGTLAVPDAGTPGRNSDQYHRAPFGIGLTIAPQQSNMGAEVKQAGAGRAYLPAGLTFPEQSTTPLPDGRRIARPMPTAATDDSQVIG